MAIVKGVGCLRHTTFLRLQSACQGVIDSVGSHVARELHAFIEYMMIYKPRMEAPESDAPSMPIDDTLVGAFSNDTTIIQRFFKAGIPVWCIIAMKDLPVFVGSSSDPQKYHKIQDFTMHSTCWVDPFALSTPIIMGQEDVPVAVLTTSSSHYSPYIIVTLNTEEKVKSYLVSWLHLQAPLFAHLTVTEQVPVNLYHQEWRTVLVMGFLHSAGETSGQAAKRCEEVQKMMSGYLEEFPLQADNDAHTAFWRGKAYESLTSEEQQEVCWELGEIDVGCANYGVAHHLWLQHAPYIFAMKKMMWPWNGPCPALLDKVQTMGWTENDFLELEKTVATHYTDSFYLYFGHAPVLPHQLSHCSSEDYVPEVRAHMSTSWSVSPIMLFDGHMQSLMTGHVSSDLQPIACHNLGKTCTCVKGTGAGSVHNKVILAIAQI
ncbi:hypothetical protein EDD18DRAFT_1100477 [Armillaria luteobubalina]|uniref:Uncharacterized protein n=1 Tax=Armillaria luteobubalina TaxID=153913 RepID=A0AA39QFI7_9AGAR|nr:hypothetical protein EDD18DRAFT_1100477 [Armillaria luteobubalina]